MTKNRNLNVKDFYNLLTDALTNHWTVLSSSDGYASFGNSNVLTNDGYGVGGFSNPNSWYVITENDGYHTYQLCVQTDGYQGVRAKFSKLGFTHGTPSLSKVPSATDEQVVLGGGTDSKPTFQKVANLHYNFNGFNLNIHVRNKDKIFNIMIKSKVATVVTQPMQVVNKILS